MGQPLASCPNTRLRLNRGGGSTKRRLRTDGGLKVADIREGDWRSPRITEAGRVTVRGVWAIGGLGHVISGL
jgi:hypothetical protein